MKSPILATAVVSAVLSLPAFAADEADTVYAKVVQPILAGTCVKCHGPDKVKGKLRLDTPENIKKGGGDGNTVVPGKSGESLLFKRINLPKDDDEHMPPEGDPLSKEQIEALKWWIDDHQASFEAKYDASKAPEVVQKLAAAAPKTSGKKAEEELPQVAAADPALMKPLQDAGVLVMPLAQNTNLLHVETVSVAKSITDQHVALLEPLAPQVAWLYLNKTAITDEALKTIAKLKQLQRLHLANTKITDVGLRYLEGLPNLETLNVYGTQVTDAALESVAKLPKLKSVYFFDTKVSSRAAFKFLNKNPKLNLNLGMDFEELKKLDQGLLVNEVFNDKVGGEAKDGNLTYADGPSAKAANFDGKAYVVAGDLANFEKSEPFSIAVWVKPAEQDLNVIAARSDSDDADRGWSLQLDKGQLGLDLVSVSADNAIRVQANAPLAKDQWYHVAATYDGSGKAEGVKLFIDGVAAESAVKQNNLTRTTKTFQVMHVGRRKGGAAFKGQLDELRVYPKALSADQVGALFDRYEFKKPAEQAAAKGGALGFLALGAAGLFDDGSCCAHALAGSKECEHECCQKAAKEGKVCLKCNPGAKDKPLPKS